MLISQESYERVQSAINEIGYSADTSDDYDEWYDIAAECITACFEDLNDEQIKMTCGAWLGRIEDEFDENIAKGYSKALLMSFEEYVEHKEQYILECNLDIEDDDYDSHEAVILKRTFEECVNRVKESCSECFTDNE